MLKARILEKSEEHLWSDFIKNHPLATIHQTPTWGHFQAEIPGREKYWIVVLEKITGAGQTHEITAGTLLIRHKLPKGYCWLYASRGPILDYADKNTAAEQMSALLKIIKKVAKQEKAIFLRIDPPLEISPAIPYGSIHPPLTLPGFHYTTHGFQPQHTLILDLTKSEQEILSQMKPKGRYNIRLAAKKDVKIRQADPSNHKKFQKDLEDFYRILQETTSRDGFRGHDLEYYEKMLKNLNAATTNAHAAAATTTPACLPSRAATLYLAEFNHHIIAGAIITYFAQTATYYFGASGNADRNLMAPYLLHWQAIKDAKEQGYKFYDFFGIATHEHSECASQQAPRPSGAKASTHPWAGVTEFKKKFGGTEVSYQPALEYPFKKILYFLYSIYKI